MINSEIVKKIEDFVYAKPRSVQEIAQNIEKNWRTADRYIKEIETFKKKEDFSAFDIYQHVSDKNKEVWLKEGKDEVSLGRLEEFAKLLLTTKKQILFFSGN